MSSEGRKEFYANRISMVLRALDLTPRQVGEMCGFSGETVRCWCTGKKVPSADSLRMFCNTVGISVDEFYKDDLNENAVKISFMLNCLPPEGQEMCVGHIEVVYKSFMGLSD